MPQANRLIAITINSIAAIALLLAPSPLSAQGVQIAREGNSMALTYTKLFGTDVTTDRSSDFLSWSSVQTEDKLVAQDWGTQTIKSSVAIGAADALFLRLRVTDAWRVILAWDNAVDPDLAGYRLSYGTASNNYTRHIDVGKATQATISLPLNEGAYFFVVTAYRTDGFESLPSQELMVPRH